MVSQKSSENPWEDVAGFAIMSWVFNDIPQELSEFSPRSLSCSIESSLKDISSSQIHVFWYMLSWGVQSYFQYYAKLANQQNMLQDGVRTSTYNRAIAG